MVVVGLVAAAVRNWGSGFLPARCRKGPARHGPDRGLMSAHWDLGSAAAGGCGVVPPRGAPCAEGLEACGLRMVARGVGRSWLCALATGLDKESGHGLSITQLLRSVDGLSASSRRAAWRKHAPAARWHHPWAAVARPRAANLADYLLLRGERNRQSLSRVAPARAPDRSCRLGNGDNRCVRANRRLLSDLRNQSGSGARGP